MTMLVFLQIISLSTHACMHIHTNIEKALLNILALSEESLASAANTYVL